MIPFHRLRIATAIVFCAGFSAWSAWDYHESPNVGTLAVSVTFAAAAAALSYYLRHLKRFLGR